MATGKNKNLELLYKFVLSSTELRREEEQKLRLKMLSVLKGILDEEFYLKNDTVKYKIEKLDSTTGICDCDNASKQLKFTIRLGEEYFNNSKRLAFLVTVLHEWGHVYCTILEKKDKLKLDYVDYDEDKVSLMDKWQQFGFNFRYESNEEEYYATKFAIKKVKDILCYAEKDGVDPKIIQKQINQLDILQIKLGISKDINKVFYKAWQGVNNFLHIKEDSSAFSDIPEGMTAEDVLYNLNKDVIESLGPMTTEDLKSEIKRIEKSAQKRASHLIKERTDSAKTADEKLYITSCYARLLAKNLGLREDEIALKIGVYDELVAFDYRRIKDENCPLYGTINVSVGNMNMLTSFEYINILKKKIKAFKMQIEEGQK